VQSNNGCKQNNKNFLMKKYLIILLSMLACQESRLQSMYVVLSEEQVRHLERLDIAERTDYVMLYLKQQQQPQYLLRQKYEQQEEAWRQEQQQQRQGQQQLRLEKQWQLKEEQECQVEQQCQQERQEKRKNQRQQRCNMRKTRSNEQFIARQNKIKNNNHCAQMRINKHNACIHDNYVVKKRNY
jgi:hypothetical protein